MPAIAATCTIAYLSRSDLRSARQLRDGYAVEIRNADDIRRKAPGRELISRPAAGA
jgi:hypothetical protein